MAAAEHERPGPIEGGKQRHGLAAAQLAQQREPDQEDGEGGQAGDPDPVRHGARLGPGSWGRRRREGKAPDQRTAGDDRHLGERRRPGKGDRGGREGERPARPVGSQRPGHREHGLGDNRDRGELEAVDPTGARQVDPRREEPEQHEGDRGRQGEPEPGDQPAEHPRPAGPDGDPELAAGGSREQLAERHEVRVRRLVEPAPAIDVFTPEVADMGDRAAERGEPETERRRQDLERGSGPPGGRPNASPPIGQASRNLGSGADERRQVRVAYDPRDPGSAPEQEEQPGQARTPLRQDLGDGNDEHDQEDLHDQSEDRVRHQGRRDGVELAGDPRRGDEVGQLGDGEYDGQPDERQPCHSVER